MGLPLKLDWETTILNQILAKNLLDLDFGNLAPFSPQLKLPSGMMGKQLFWAKSWPAAFLGGLWASGQDFVLWALFFFLGAIMGLQDAGGGKEKRCTAQNERDFGQVG